jgi:aryl-alcohol dehydrogenase-like predicted oxidoreductase
MQTRKLGNNGPVVSAIGLGCMGLNYTGSIPRYRSRMSPAR